MQGKKVKLCGLGVVALLALAAAPVMAQGGRAHVDKQASAPDQQGVVNPHMLRLGWIKTVSYGPSGIEGITRKAIDMRIYMRSGSTRIVPIALSQHAATISEDTLAASIGCLDFNVDACDWGEDDDPPVVPDPNEPQTTIPNIGPGNTGPTSGPPVPPFPKPNIACNVGKVEFTQFYRSGGGIWVQESEYRRPVFSHPDGGCSNGPWSEPIITQHPKDDS